MRLPISAQVANDDRFKLDRVWYPIVSEEEVRNYSKENNWENG
jgi:hypothetical protein